VGPIADTAARRYATGAWLDFTTVTLMVDVAILRDALAHLPRLAIAAVPEAPAGKHPVCIDLSRVRDGRPEPGGTDLHRWSELTGASMGALAGAGASGLMGAWMGPLGFYWGAIAGATYGSAAGQRLARGVSEAASRSVGTYNEAMAFVPNVVTRDGRGPFLFSLGMHTDSVLSKRLAEVYRSGFGKRMAAIACHGFDRYEVRSPEGALLASASFTSPESSRPAREAPALRHVIDWLAQPVLGHAGGGALSVSHVDRFYDDPTVRVAAVRGRLDVHEGFAPGVPRGSWTLGESVEATAFQAAYVPVRLDFPVPL
jgi:hypothetical protein